MSRLVKSYLTSTNGEHIVRVHPIVPKVPDLREAEDEESILARAKQQAQEIVRAAQGEHAKLKADIDSWAKQRKQELEAEAVELRENAQREGFEQGYREGGSAAESAWLDQMLAARDTVTQALAAREAFLAESEPLFKTIAIAIAERLIRTELSIRPEVVVETVRTCLREVQDKGVVEVRVHPNDYTYVFSRKHDLDACLSGQSEVLIVPDTEVSAGGCLVYTSHGSFDARIETGLDEIRKALQDI